MTLSVCIIARNEQLFLPECIESVRGIAGEIIVVDTGSSDDTRLIARRAGCRVIDFIWNDDFAAARNFAIAHAKGEWIYCIDADERLLNPDILRAVLAQANHDIGGILLTIQSEARRADNSGSDIHNTKILRIFRNLPGIEFRGIIHEQVLDSILAAGLKIMDSPVMAVHLGYDLGQQALQAKQKRNLDLLEKAIERNSQDAYLWLHKGKTLMALGAPVMQADMAFQKAVEYAMDKPGIIVPQALNHRAILALQQQNPEYAAGLAEQSLQLLPSQKFARYILAEALFLLADFERAAALYRQAALATDDAKAMLAGELRLPQTELYYKAGRCMIALKQWGQAQQEFSKGLDINPQDIPCLIGMANALMRLHHFEDARKFLLQAQLLRPADPQIPGYLQMLEAEQQKYIQEHQEQAGSAQQQVKSGQAWIQHSSTPLLALAMIVKNEEKNLPGCLESVQGIADQIIIVDTGSQDSTQEIARQAGAELYHFEWIGDFAAARNQALRHCTARWILYLDADERLDPKARLYLRPLLESLESTIGALLCTIRSPHRQLDDSTEMHSGSYPRIFRNLGYPAIRFQGRVHEQISPSLLEHGLEIVQSEVEILHLGYDQSREIMEQKVKRNYQLLIRHVQEEPENAYAWFQLGQTLARMQMNDQAQQALELSLQLGTLRPHIAASAAAVLAQIAGNKGNFTRALHWADYSLEKVPAQLYALHLKAYSLLHLRRFAEAEQLFMQVLERANKHKQGELSQAGFEIEIPEKAILRGLEMARKGQIVP